MSIIEMMKVKEVKKVKKVKNVKKIIKAAIVANGEIGDHDFHKGILEESDYIIACDGGLRHCHILGVVPDCIIGDLDSIEELCPPDILEKYPNIPVLQFPAEKDQTDLELALDHACDKGADSIVILCGLGGRFDHQIANAHILAQPLKKGVQAELQDEDAKIMLIDNKCRLHKSDGILVSLLPLTTTVEGVITEGLKFPLKDESLQIGFARGVSNQITKEWADISVKAGLLLVVQTRKK